MPRPTELAEETTAGDLKIHQIELSKIFHSPTNPRKIRNKDKDDELAESIKVHGVQQPLLLRPVASRFEIVFGERRFDGSIAAGKKTAPAIVKELTDVQVMELQILENDQRDDVDDFDRAMGYRALYREYHKAHTKPGEAKQLLEDMAARMGKKPRTLYNIMKLAELSPDAQKALKAGKIDISHAYEICRRPPKTQAAILHWIRNQSYGDQRPSVRDLKQFISSRCDHFLDTAPFPKEDATLVPKMGACTTCEFNSAVNPNTVEQETLVKLKGRALCTNSECWQSKSQAHLVRIEAEAGADTIRVSVQDHNNPKGSRPSHLWKQVPKGSCQYATPAIVVDGDHAGKQITVCIMNNLCKPHWKPEKTAPAHPRTPAQKKAMLQKQRRAKEEQAFRAAATTKIRKQVKSLSVPDLKDAALAMIYRMDRRLRNPVFAAMGLPTTKGPYGPPIPIRQIEKMKPADVAALLTITTIAPAILPGIEPYYDGHYSATAKAKLAAIAKRHKLNLTEIRNQAAKPLRDKWREIDTRKSRQQRKRLHGSRKEA